MQMYSAEGRLSLFLFSVVFFCLSYILSINPIRIIDYIGQSLTPALLGVLAILLIRLFLHQFQKSSCQSFSKGGRKNIHIGCNRCFRAWDCLQQWIK
ncbi:branched-chain amino acid transport system II carrier protein [Cytobacillus oceanisediminis]|nr:branched-chain amino acid transport system II carrier protein [Cytobacillus oceanisediminis]